MKVLTFSISLTIFVALGCATTEPHQAVSKNNFPVVLFVGNESGGYVNPVNIAVSLDGSDTVFNRMFFGNAGHSQFKLTLTSGTHQLIAETSNGNAGLDVVFNVDKPLWLVLGYWGKQHFQLNISDKPVVFM